MENIYFKRFFYTGEYSVWISLISVRKCLWMFPPGGRRYFITSKINNTAKGEEVKNIMGTLVENYD